MRTVYVVPHCHWDREWYQPHELFRWRLVRMIDELLEHMEQHPEYRCFNLDGQTIVIEDYLELRPENEGRLKALIEQRRIVIGPWLVQPDEFLPSGESHIRSLQRGIRFADRLGGSLRVGHCADQFGHIAQMPQIMRQLGLTSACLWRGVPDAVPGWSFQWEAPDGTRLPVLYLRNSYSSGWRLPAEPEALLERTRRQERERRDDEPALLMNGTDHSRMEKHVPEALASAAGRGFDFRLATLADYERAMFEAGIGDYVHRGELRSPDRSNVLVGVLSARMNIKQRDFHVSALLERVAEPLELLSWLHHGPDGGPALRHAWRLLLENSPHDSICGCSVDQTHREMLPRYDRAEQLAGQVARESMGHLAAKLEVPEPGGLVVFRTVQDQPQTLGAVVPASWAMAGLRTPGGAAIPVALGPVTASAVLQHEAVSANGALRHLDFIREGRYDNNYVEAMTWKVQGRHLSVETVVGQGLNVVDDEAVRREIAEAVGAGLANTAEVTVRRSATRELRAVLPPAGAIGVELLKPSAAAPGTDIATTKDSIANAFYQVRYRQGRIEVRDWRNGIVLRDACAFIDEGDRGDEYNADILDDRLRGRVSLVAVEADAVSARLELDVAFPAHPGLNRRQTRRRRGSAGGTLQLRVTVTLWSGLPRVEFDVAVENGARDHRLRAAFRLPFATERLLTENQFHVGERALEPPAWNGVSAEQPPTTFPQKTFAAMEGDGVGVAMFNRGLPEGELVRGRKVHESYALTLLRSVGWLSRNDLRTRRGGAGPMIETPDAQMPGRHAFAFALTTYRGGWREAGVQAMAHAFAYPPVAWTTNGHDGSETGGALPLARLAKGLTVSAMARSEADGAPFVRAYATGEEAAVYSVAVPAAGEVAERMDFLEQREAAVTGADGWTLELRPWEIATVRFGRA